MGSLMAGWNSPVLKSKQGDVYKRNRSLTKDDIDAYWRTQKKSDANTINIPQAIKEVSGADESGRKIQKASSCPVSKDIMDPETSSQNIINHNGWWTRSNSAFLNEPPVLEGATNTYVSQFHVASWAAGSNAQDQIST